MTAPLTTPPHDGTASLTVPWPGHDGAPMSRSQSTKSGAGATRRSQPSSRGAALGDLLLGAEHHERHTSRECFDSHFLGLRPDGRDII